MSPSQTDDQAEDGRGTVTAIGLARAGAPPRPPAISPAQAQLLHALLAEAGVAIPADLLAVLPPLPPSRALEDGRVAVPLRLKRRHFDYLTERARQHGQAPARHLETILLEFRSYHDTRRPDQQQPPAAPGAPVSARRG